MSAFAKAVPRPLRRSDYRELKNLYKQQTEKYLVALRELLYELDHRRVPWDVTLRNEVRKQISCITDQFNAVLQRLP